MLYSHRFVATKRPISMIATGRLKGTLEGRVQITMRASSRAFAEGKLTAGVRGYFFLDIEDGEHIASHEHT